LENKKLLVPVGGGKDSATLLGILESKKLDYNILLLSPLSPAAKAIAVLLKNEGHCQNIIEVERSIDPKLLKLNQIGYLNGHTPFSAYLAFLSVTVAYLYGHDLVLLSNESSADEENTIFHGRKVNHQYSKSSEFEKKFQDYSQEFLFDKSEQKPFYFSLLRPLSELQIAKTLVQLARNDKNFKKILSIFRSCNVGQKQGIWCHNCPKCAFVFTIFSAFLEPDFVSEQIFRKNLFEKESLRETFFELAGLRDKKPFECVGTFAETREAISLASKQYQEKNLPLPKTLADLQQSLKETRMNQDAK
jgi:7-cyano-7-deazaguanine synthase in queuosine biosynthesis